MQGYVQFWFVRKETGTSFLHILYMIFQEKYFYCYILLADQISLSDCLYFFKILGNMCIEITF